MEIEQKKHQRLSEEQHGTLKSSLTHKEKAGQEIQEVAPGIPVVRSSTPRPSSMGQIPASEGLSLHESEAIFPSNAPSAPPLPEELGEELEGDAGAIAAVGLAKRPRLSAEEAQEFLWLFEYGLEMDGAILNSPERLDGLALLYGPAVLNGYKLAFASASSQYEYSQQTITIVEPDPDSEVWGVLYRIPRRLTENMGDEPSLLDIVHAAAAPQGLFKATEVVVRETYRDREIRCVIYVATDAAHQLLLSFPADRGGGDSLFIQRLVTIARKQKLPERYLSKYLHLLMPTLVAPPQSDIGVLSRQPIEQNTEPIPAINEKGEMLLSEKTDLPDDQGLSHEQSYWLVTFAIYLVSLLLLVLTFAMLQGLGHGGSTLNYDFSMLGVPWLVLVYGLLGGCISSIVTLGRAQPINPPVFVIITWFTRPFIGAVLALLTYQFLTSGFFIFATIAGGQDALFFLAGALAGLCEGWMFTRPK